MIIDKLSNFNRYLSLNKNFKDVNNFLVNTKIEELPIGKTIINTETFALISQYDTKSTEESFIEFHKKYIDIQIVLSGEENIGYVPFIDCKEIMFDEEKDYGKLTGKLVNFILKPSNFVMLFPYEGHTPQLKISETSRVVKKIVIKVSYN